MKPTSRLPFVLALAALTSAGVSQTLTLPLGTDTAEGNTQNSFPWGSVSFPGLLIQAVYSANDFAPQGVSGPILINRIRWRANGVATTTSWTGGTFTVGNVSMATSPVGWTAVPPGTSTSFSFVPQRGADYKLCYTGPVTFQGGAGLGTGVIGQTVVDVALESPFLYDPTAGDLVIETDHLCTGNFTEAVPGGSPFVQLDCKTTGASAARVFASSNYPTAQGSITPHGTVVALDYMSAAGLLYPAFSPDVRKGLAPLSVTFTDHTYSAAPGGVTSWAWDFDNNGTIDSTLQNPTYVYNTCGTFDVTLTVTDAAHPAGVSTTHTALISTDDIKANFDVVFVAPDVFQLVDTSVPAANGWAWDFDGDGIVDSTAPSPVTAMPMCQLRTVRYTASYNCKSDTIQRTLFPSPNHLTTQSVGSTNGTANYQQFSDFTVTNPIGVNICSLDVNSGSALGTAFTADIYLTPNTFVGKDADATQWQLVATGSGTTAGPDQPSHMVLSHSIYLANGSYGLAVKLNGATPRMILMPTGTTATYSDSNLSITTGVRRTTLFGGTQGWYQWCATVNYDTPQTGGTAGLGWFGKGCAGSLPVSAVTVNQGLVIGTTTSLTFNNLPFNIAIGVIGNSNGAPLPLDLTFLGAPGCWLRVGLDLTATLAGVGNQATLAFPVPNTASLIGVPLFFQSAALDTFNSFGFVMSDAWAGVVGI